MKTLIFMVYALLISDTQTINMGSEPLNKGFVILDKVLKISDQNDGFYNRVYTRKIKNTYVSLDIGNKRVVLFDEQGKEVLSFGKEGNGPGEISRPQTIFGNSSYLYVIDNGRASIFDYTGKYIFTIKERGWPIVTDESIYYDFRSRGNIKILSKTYSIKGELIKEVSNPNYKEPTGQQNFFDEKRVKEMLTRPYGYAPYKNGYLQIVRGPYQIEYITDKKKTILTRNFKRIKTNQSPIPVRVSGKRTKEMDENIKKMNAAALAITGGYLPDISSIIGFHKGYIFVDVNSDSNTDVYIDVISPDFEWVDQIHFTGDEFRSFSIYENTLIANKSNDDEGPYSEVYRISFSGQY